MVTMRALFFWLLALPCVAALAGCRTSAGGTPDGQVVADFASPFGPCYAVARKANLGCYNDGNCGGPFQKCQLGRCCSGVIDPKTCLCPCNGGPPCDEWNGELCCNGLGRKHPPFGRDLGVLMCRSDVYCEDQVGP